MKSKFLQLREIYKELKKSWEVQSIFSNDKKITKDWTGYESYKLLENSEDIQDIIEQNKNSVLLNLFVRKAIYKWSKWIFFFFFNKWWNIIIKRWIYCLFNRNFRIKKYTR